MITQKAAEGLGIERSSVWFYDQEKSKIVCKSLYETKTGKHDYTPLELPCNKFPVYFKYLKTEDTIAADDARTNKATAEFTDVYLKPLNIYSMLDVPIKMKGVMIGVICNESVGKSRTWTMEDETFIRNLVAMLIIGIEAINDKQRNKELINSQKTLNTQFAKMKALNAELEQKNQELIEKNQEIITQEEELRQTLEEIEATQETLKKQQLEIQNHNQRLLRQSEILNQLFSLHLIDYDKHKAFQKITEAAAEGLNTTRSSIWLYDNNFTLIRSMDLYVKGQGHSNGVELLKKDFPQYFKSLEREEVIAAGNAHTHPDTFEFSEVYLKPLGIGAMLDIPIKINGKMIGVLCNEHVGNERKWALDEENFGKALSALIAMIIEADERKNKEIQLMEMNRELLTHEEELRQNMEEVQAMQEQLRKQNQEIENQHRVTKKQNKILAEITGKNYGKNFQNKKDIFLDITEKLAEGLEIERSSIWLYNEEKTAIVCHDLYEKLNHKHSEGVSLMKSDFPNYFNALLREETIVASSARTHQDTCEFTEVYLKPLGIYSMLDIPIRVNGEMIGVICNETLNPKLWNLEDETFARAVSSQISILLENEEKQRMEQALKSAQERFELALNGTKDGLWDWDLTNNTVYFSPKWKEMLGYNDDILPNQLSSFWTNIHEEDLKNVQNAIEEYLTGKSNKFECEFRMKHSNGEWIWILSRGTAIFNDKNQPKRFLGFHSDITLKKNQEQQQILNDKMVTLGTLMAGVAHEINTPLGAIRASSDNMSNFMKYLVYDLPTTLNQLESDLTSIFYDLIHECSLNKKPLTTREERQLKKQLTEELENNGFEDARNLADTLVKIGIHQPSKYLPLLKHQKSDKILNVVNQVGKIYAGLDTIQIAVNKSQKMISALKNYSNTRDFDKPVPVDLSQNVDMVITMYHNAMKQGIELIKNFENVPTILCYEDEISQVWTNMIWNAIQAMKGNGILEIHIAQIQNEIHIAIKDNGPGIPHDIQSKIFEPFFTTKAKGEGTGLGLHICKKIIEKHYGTIELFSIPGNTTFTVKIPLNSPLQLTKSETKEVVLN